MASDKLSAFKTTDPQATLDKDKWRRAPDTPTANARLERDDFDHLAIANPQTFSKGRAAYARGKPVPKTAGK